jgi:hypothetical protein
LQVTGALSKPPVKQPHSEQLQHIPNSNLHALFLWLSICLHMHVFEDCLNAMCSQCHQVNVVVFLVICCCVFQIVAFNPTISAGIPSDKKNALLCALHKVSVML